MANDSNGKDGKYQDQVRKGTGAQGAGGNADAPTVPTGPLVSKCSQTELDAMLKEQGYEYAPQVKSLEEGDRVSGVLEGNGPMAEFADKDTGEIKEVQTWILASPDGAQRISILSAAQLDRKLPPFIGGMVDIVRGKDLKTSNGHRVTDYLVRGPRLKDGQRRSFVQPPKMIEATAQEGAKALPAATTPAPEVAATPAS
jgi:hypothetical protein